ncbi:MAG TPA: molybdopterin-dependent oxidoreductase, partial [Ktedonobacterales bacterium]|nr:molybdopterin-dependent oxidoreductase [Ktedonobacterales bacterium]
MAHDESQTGSRTSYITCPLCEATCGLEVVTSGPEVVSIRGNKNDVFSHGYICPKAYALKELHSDPDRLRTPMIRTGESWREATWDEAFAEIDRRLPPLLAEHGRDAAALYIGNPAAHGMTGLLYGRV